MNTKYLVGLMGLLTLTAACQPTPTALPINTPVQETSSAPTSTLTLTPNITVSPTASPTASQAPAVTPTATATPSPYPTLTHHGPYLLYTKSGGYGPLFLVNAGLQGRKTLELPAEVYIPNLSHAVSPDGKWLAFHMGSTEAPYDLTLNLLAIPAGTVHPVTKLLSSEYPSNFAPVVDFYTQLQGEALLSETEQVFAHALQAFAWSPDGRYLAFAGQMDGPSSDLYVYDVQTGAIRRLTDDLRILDWISWSPDGQWLLITNALFSVNYGGATLHRIRADSPVVQDPPILEEGFWWAGVDWITPNTYLITGSPDGGDPYGLRYLDVQTGQMHDLWPEIYFSYAVDPEHQLLAVNGVVGESADGEMLLDETFLVDFAGKRMPLSAEVDWLIGFHSGPNPRFVGLSAALEHLVTIAQDGTVVQGNAELQVGGDLLASADGQWYILYEASYGRVPVALFSADHELVRTFSGLEARGALWRTDEAGLFVANDNTLYYVAIPDGAPVQVDECSPQAVDCRFNEQHLVWLP